MANVLMTLIPLKLSNTRAGAAIATPSRSGMREATITS